MIRAIILLLFWPLLQRWGYGITARDGIVLAWSGLRGAARPTRPPILALEPRMCTVKEAQRLSASCMAACDKLMLSMLAGIAHASLRAGC